MKKTFLIFALISGVLISCNSSGDAESNEKDTINASKGSDSLLQNQLNADTSANSSPAVSDNISTKRDSIKH